MFPGVHSTQRCSFNSFRSVGNGYTRPQPHLRAQRWGGAMYCRVLILYTKQSSGYFIKGLFHGGQTREKSIFRYWSSISLPLLFVCICVCLCMGICCVRVKMYVNGYELGVNSDPPSPSPSINRPPNIQQVGSLIILTLTTLTQSSSERVSSISLTEVLISFSVKPDTLPLLKKKQERNT